MWTPSKTMTSYFNPEEAKAAFKIEDYNERLELIKNLADKGNVQAAYYYGKVLMVGGWDIGRMEMDFALGKLLPATANPREDPYMIIQRDQHAAIEYLRKAASLEAVNCSEIKTASAMMAFCRRKQPNIGDTPARLTDAGICMGLLVIEGVAKPADREASPFIAFSSARPKPRHPGKRVFFNYSLNAFISLTSQLYFFLLIFPLYFVVTYCSNEPISGNQVFWLLVGWSLCSLPVCFERLANITYGLQQSLPICSCHEMRKAYNLRLGRLPVLCRSTDNPFESTSILVRNMHAIKQYLYVLLVIVGLLMAIIKFAQPGPVVNASSYMATMIMAFFGSLRILWDEKTLEWKDRFCLKELAIETELSEKIEEVEVV